MQRIMRITVVVGLVTIGLAAWNSVRNPFHGHVRHNEVRIYGNLNSQIAKVAKQLEYEAELYVGDEYDQMMGTAEYLDQRRREVRWLIRWRYWPPHRARFILEVTPDEVIYLYYPEIVIRSVSRHPQHLRQPLSEVRHAYPSHH